MAENRDRVQVGEAETAEEEEEKKGTAPCQNNSITERNFSADFPLI